MNYSFDVKIISNIVVKQKPTRCCVDYHKPAARVSRKFLSLEGLTSSRREDITEDGYCWAITQVIS